MQLKLYLYVSEFGMILPKILAEVFHYLKEDSILLFIKVHAIGSNYLGESSILVSKF
jgi:hypothetical protein